MVYLCSAKENSMDFDEFYRALERLKKDGETVNAYGGSEKDIDHPDGSVLNDIMEHICEKYPNERPIWMEAFYQVFNWQYSAMYEGLAGYYDNFYGESDYRKITATAEFLKENGYAVVAEQYISGIVECKRYEYPPEKRELAKKIELCVDWDTEPVWEFYLDILEKHRNDWAEIQGTTNE